MEGSNGGGDRINSFALVSYLPQPLAGFLDHIRRDLSNEPYTRAHVTVLPPRPLLCPSDDAWRELLDGLPVIQPFRAELVGVEVFPVTGVIYLSIGAGHDELKQLHDKLAVGNLAHPETFEYHPHVTLAKDLPMEKVPAAAEDAARRWHAFTRKTSFMVDRLSWVQNTTENRWTDLSGWALSQSRIGPEA
jgi:2'-5' RNA ligase